MIDLHCHVLPAVDDGPVDLEAALDLCHTAAREGSEVLVATPHLRHRMWWNGDRQHLETQWRRVCEALGEPRPGAVPQLLLGGEVAIGMESAAELQTLEPANLADADLLSLAGSRYLLLELDPHGFGPDPVELVHELRVAGFEPILAHPERISWLMSDLGLLEAALRAGARLQVTAAAITGDYGEALAETAHALLDADLVCFVASDAHDAERRPPGLRRAFELVAETWGQTRADALFRDNPQRVIDDLPLDDGPSAKTGGSR